MLEKIINDLEEKVNNSILDSDLENIFSKLSEIKNPTLVCGIGGSHVVSIFLEKILAFKNNIIIKNINAEEYFLNNFSKYDNLIVVSHSGKNNGVKRLLNSNMKKYLFTTRKSKVSNEIILNYSIKNKIKSFVSLDSTIIPISILLCYYINSYNLKSYMLPLKESFNILEFKDVDIIYDYNSETCATFLETSFVEAGISHVTMHTKYSFCHGRSNLISNTNSLVIYLITNKSELDVILTNMIAKISNNILILQAENTDPIIADYMLTIKALYFLDYLSKSYNMEFIKVKYNKIVPTIYNFKGELA